MSYKSRLSLAVAAVALGLAAHASASTPLPSGSFVMLSSSASCPQESPALATTCYMTNPAQATAVVTNLQKAGVEYFLIPSATLGEAEVLGDAVDRNAGKFLSYERWAYEAAVNGGSFDCATYTTDRIIPFLIPLKLRYPMSFTGLELKDEPTEPEHATLGAMVACVRQQQQLADLKIFVNLPPVNANDYSLNVPNSELAGALGPADFGVDCQANSLVDRNKYNAMIDRYTRFAISALDQIKPDYLAFDLYPFNGNMDNCSAAVESLMTGNMSIIAQQSLARGVVPIAYLQNYENPNAGADPSAPRQASFRELRWYSAWFYLLGGRGTANFISHDVGNDMLGMLDANNNPRDIAIAQQSVYGFTRQVQDAIRGYDYQDFVAPWLGVPTGALVGWLPSSAVMASEYRSQTNGTAIVTFVSRPKIAINGTPIGLNQWWASIEKLNFDTGLWEAVGQGTNAITVDFGDFPAAVYRLSP